MDSDFYYQLYRSLRIIKDNGGRGDVIRFKWPVWCSVCKARLGVYADKE